MRRPKYEVVKVARWSGMAYHSPIQTRSIPAAVPSVNVLVDVFSLFLCVCVGGIAISIICV